VAQRIRPGKSSALNAELDFLVLVRAAVRNNEASAKFCSECGNSLSVPISAPVPETLAVQPREMSGERRHLTVLFCDLVGSTEISARLDPEEFRELVADYHRTTAEAIIHVGGNVAKYLGDGVMAYFGWPEAHDNDAERAARAGLAIVDAVGALNQRDGQGIRPKLSVRVGIDSGTVVIGKGVGSDSEVFGDAANIAARVQSSADPDMVIVTPTVNRLVAGLFVVEARGAHQLKGIAEPVELYRIVRLSSLRSRLAASSVRGMATNGSPCVSTSFCEVCVAGCEQPTAATATSGSVMRARLRSRLVMNPPDENGRGRPVQAKCHRCVRRRTATIYETITPESHARR